MAYANADLLRVIVKAVTTEVFSDTDVATLSAGGPDTVINARLASKGAPYSPTPDLVAYIATLLCIGDIFDGVYYQTAEESAFGKAKRDLGYKLLEQVANGELDATEVAAETLVYSPPEALAAPAEQVFVGHREELWQFRRETRES